MKRWLWALAVCGTAPADVYTAGDLVKDAAASDRVLDNRSADADGFNAGHFLGYVFGVRDLGLSAHLLCRAADHDVGGEQQLATVKLYLNEHPQRWHEPAQRLVIEALQQVLPCKQ